LRNADWWFGLLGLCDLTLFLAIGNSMSTSTHLMTAEELIKLPRGRFRYELVKGELLTMSPPGEEHGAIALALAAELYLYVKANKLGIVYAADTGFKLESNPDTVLAPDVSFIARERIREISKKYREGAPDLAVEVVSPNERRSKIEKKVGQWLQLGARLVWIVNPETKSVSVYRLDGSVNVLSESDELTGDDVVAGFKISVSDIFNLGNF
jgi:Uma2 family endonuclease